MNAASTVGAIQILISFAVLLQSVEMISLRKSWCDEGPWSWPVVRGDVRWKTMRPIFDLIFNEKSFFALLVLQLLSALASIVLGSMVLTSLLLLVSVLTALRWRGTFNGGSDLMTLTVLAGLWLARFGELTQNNFLIHLALTYIAIQGVLSYVIAGVVKLKHSGWRDGSYLPLFLKASTYQVPAAISNWNGSPILWRFLAWSILLFECSFFVVFLEPRALPFYLAAGLCFHFANALVLGLNRFFWAWMSMYPALFYAVLAR